MLRSLRCRIVSPPFLAGIWGGQSMAGFQCVRHCLFPVDLSMREWKWNFLPMVLSTFFAFFCASLGLSRTVSHGVYR
ncbi:unnamed protein product [Tuber melanosporum]|uniref:(Perigord truffle) hypothetical protein n=1 Tax=Tuber melanosporum (strain Mel28) TaxID=656061 RepID=D5G796_TUBMM|nr:uncharacterized protein GSTUM_00002522001 [Tuber melanosporum]CAZ80389.1 unnamed protein product [Tuber melanosporum]